MSSCRQRSRSAEQRWPAERKADVITSSITCSGSAVASTIIALMPPVSAINGTIGPSFAARVRLMARPTSVEPVKATPATFVAADEEGAHSAVAGHEMQRGLRHAGFVQKCDRARGDQRCLLRGLGDDGIAGGERRAHLAEKDRERKIPRADANKDAAPAVAQYIAFAGRPGHRLRAEAGARLRGIIAAIVDSLADFGERVVERLAAFILQERQELGRDFSPIDPQRGRARAPAHRLALSPKRQSRLRPLPWPRARSSRPLRARHR